MTPNATTATRTWSASTTDGSWRSCGSTTSGGASSPTPDDDGRTWTPLRYTGFLGSNIKLQRLNSGAVICVYRDEEPARRGVSVSVTEDGGETWRFVGQLYASHMDPNHVPSLLCGYPDMAYLDDTRMIGVLHTYPDDADRMYLHQFELRDVS